MMGRLSHDQEQFFYSFRLDEAVPEDHAVREIAAVLDLSWAHSELAPYYPEIGRPSIDPVLMIRMLIVGYVFGIRSERGLCREVQVNLAYRWFCGLSIEDKVPDHSAFSRARNERFGNSNVFRCVFERIVGTCIAAGLVGGEGFAVDASSSKPMPTSTARSRARSGTRIHDNPELYVDEIVRWRMRNGLERCVAQRSSQSISSTAGSGLSWMSKLRAPSGRPRSVPRRR